VRVLLPAHGIVGTRRCRETSPTPHGGADSSRAPEDDAPRLASGAMIAARLTAAVPAGRLSAAQCTLFRDTVGLCGGSPSHRLDPRPRTRDSMHAPVPPAIPVMRPGARQPARIP
jgi:hypothetical protein